MAFEAETPASRFDRDYLHMGKKTVPEPGKDDDRKNRQLDQQSTERQARLYVNAATGESATGKSDPAVDALFD
ncbi:hypothetical protein FDI69_gp188 [Rhodococcus phage Trina]|uniref:Uncharacterized protein n=1 Tax=Rhodococcus phage Trina TaxID=2027905 RepID=A0A2D0ZNN8_9CAUD|nr:hypothetical protein FDI69_gp188 [Rhodococcus phage Trina]ASZ74998.1 hypothetical protein SEA_TRINA_219 [Rhodococcus phage Trina]